jgi:hypothetical protein
MFDLYNESGPKKMSIALYIVCEPRDRGKPLALARIEDRMALLAAARAAISEAEARANDIDDYDEVLGELQREEAQRLKNSLERLIPDLTFAPSVM